MSNGPSVITQDSDHSSADSKAELLGRLVQRARAMVPTLRERAAGAEQARRVPDETIHEFIDAGFLRILQPARYGGYELDWGTAQVAIGSELGRGCGSSAWVGMVMATQSWVTGMFPIEGQDEIWGENPDALVCCSYRPENAELEPVSDGYKVTGHWRFASGVDSAQWALLGGAIRRNGGPPEVAWCLAPARDYQVVDTWFAGGLRATGSKDIVISGAFIPQTRVVPLQLLMNGKGPGGAVHKSHLYRFPIFSLLALNLCTPALGIARGAVEEFAEQAQRQPQRPGMVRRAEMESNQLLVAEAAVMVDAAKLLLMRDGVEMNDTVRTGGLLSLEQRARFRRDTAYVAAQCIRAVDIIHTVNGAHGIFDDNPIQRALRDAHALTTHQGLQWRNVLGYGRLTLGLEPGTEY